MRNPSALSSMYRSRPTAAVSNLSLVRAPSSRPVTMVSSRSTSRSTTTAYRPSLPPKCSYTTGWETSAAAAISSIEVPSKPRSANSRRPMSSSCCRRSWPVILLRADLGGWLLTRTSLRLRGDRATSPAGTGDRAVPGKCPHGHVAQLPLGAGRTLGAEPVLVRPAHVVGPAQLLEPADDTRARVQLALQGAVPRAGRVGVVQVVPGLAERGDGQPGHVARLVADLELLAAEGVADGVDRPGHVVQQRDAHQAGPEEGGHRALPGHPPQPADQRGQQQGHGHQQREQAVDPLDPPVGEQVRGELLLRGLVRVEQP